MDVVSLAVWALASVLLYRSGCWFVVRFRDLRDERRHAELLARIELEAAAAAAQHWPQGRSKRSEFRAGQVR